MWLTADIPNVEFNSPRIPEIKTEISQLESADALQPRLSPPLAISKITEVNANILKRTGNTVDKEIIAVNFLSGELKHWSYYPGDTIGVLPKNPDSEIKEILERTGNFSNRYSFIEIKTSRRHLPSLSTLYELFSKYINIHAIPQKTLLRTLAQYCNKGESNRLLFLSSQEGTLEYRNLILEKGIDFYSLFLGLQSLVPPINVLVDLLPGLTPRPYSIASDSIKKPDSITILISVKPPGQEGLCTGMLRRSLEENCQTKAEIFLRKPSKFRFIDDFNIPVILVGPGTGIAPFLALLEHRQNIELRGKMLLFTGFRCKADFLFDKEVNEYLKTGILTKLFVSYSREGDCKEKYVQDLLRRESQEIAKLLQEDNAILYSCGSKEMEGSITDAIVNVIQKYKNSSKEEAVERVKALKKDGQFLHDTWY